MPLLDDDADEEKIWSHPFSVSTARNWSGFSNLAYAPTAFAISRIQRAMES